MNKQIKQIQSSAKKKSQIIIQLWEKNSTER